MSRPGKIVCVGRNYVEHARELGNEMPKEPLLFFKPSSSVIGSGDVIVLPPQSSQVEFEGEIGVIIGKKIFHATEAEARAAIDGIAAVNDVTARDLQKTDELDRILDRLSSINAKRATARPIFVKVAPDLADDDAHRCAEVAVQTGCKGLVVSNTTVSREHLVEKAPEGPGGVSGAPLFRRSTELLKSLAAAHASLTFVGVGGVEDAATARAKLDAGAALVQTYTGFVYGGPSWVRRRHASAGGHGKP